MKPLQVKVKFIFFREGRVAPQPREGCLLGGESWEEAGRRLAAVEGWSPLGAIQLLGPGAPEAAAVCLWFAWETQAPGADWVAIDRAPEPVGGWMKRWRESPQ